MSKEVKDIRSEEIRALFVLGLLAVLASIRTQSINAVIGKTTLPLNPIINITIILMSFYALFMVFGVSRDMIGENLAVMFKSLALAVLLMNFVLLMFFGIVYAVAFYQNRLLWSAGIITRARRI